MAITLAYNMHCIATPTLMLFGQLSSAREHNAPLLFSGFQRFGIPAELVIYDEGHLVERPTAKVDVGLWMAAWCDCWVHDRSHPEPALDTHMTRGAARTRRSGLSAVVCCGLMQALISAEAGSRKMSRMPVRAHLIAGLWPGSLVRPLRRQRKNAIIDLLANPF